MKIFGVWCSDFRPRLVNTEWVKIAWPWKGPRIELSGERAEGNILLLMFYKGLDSPGQRTLSLAEKMWCGEYVTSWACESVHIKINEQWFGVEYNEAVKIKSWDLYHCDPSNWDSTDLCIQPVQRWQYHYHWSVTAYTLDITYWHTWHTDIVTYFPLQ